MPKKTPEETAQYMRDWRERRKVKTELEPVFIDIPKHRKVVIRQVETETVIGEGGPKDRTDGLPRSNYYGDWTETIQKMDTHLATRILDKVAPPRRMR